MVYQNLAECDMYTSVEDEDEVDCGTQAVKCSLIINPSKRRDYTKVKAHKSVAKTK